MMMMNCRISLYDHIRFGNILTAKMCRGGL